jgi:uncharacterized protein (DUF362 family)
MERREFIALAAASAGASLCHAKVANIIQPSDQITLAVVKNGSPEEMTRKAVELLGGMGRVVRPGQTVAIKPNMSWQRPPELAANTNPGVVAEAVRMCLEAGAKRVMVFDRTIENPSRCYITSGIAKAAAAAGADVQFTQDRLFEQVSIDGAYRLKEWTFYREALEADVLINIPILKRHILTSMTLGFKNMMGLVGGNRERFHGSFDEMIVDVNRVLRPKLTIMDAYRALTQNGPGGGSLAGVIMMKTIVAGTDPVQVDSVGARLLGGDAKHLGYPKLAEKAGLGTTNITDPKPVEFSFSSRKG